MVRRAGRVISASILAAVSLAILVFTGTAAATSAIILGAPFELASPHAQPGGVFGWSVAADGTVIVVGAIGETASGQFSAGHAYVFSEKTHALIATLTSPHAQMFGFFGDSVAANGTVMVVGAIGETASGQGFAGHAYVITERMDT